MFDRVRPQQNPLRFISITLCKVHLHQAYSGLQTNITAPANVPTNIMLKAEEAVSLEGNGSHHRNTTPTRKTYFKRVFLFVFFFFSFFLIRGVSFVTCFFCAGWGRDRDSWGCLWAGEVGQGLLTKLQPAVTASAGTQLKTLSASAPFPPTPRSWQIGSAFLIFPYHNPVEDWLPALPTSLPSGMLTTSCLPAWDSSCKLAEGQKHCRGGIPSCNSCSAADCSFASWCCFPDKVLPDLGGGEKKNEEPEAPQEGTGSALAETYGKTDFPFSPTNMLGMFR